ncbi:AraC family transcriptional regulator [Aridibaculum aurantiacum]|uniref:AraC family transcriptional regulator n=1 Tax=Aridibaculum aurantiacum TaxID=2810307 RepID=UPI001A971532|nr:AraC family transcriptional regulator [Aridibaculum aurantiacum]
MDQKGGSHKNIWYGLGRQRIEIPKPVLKSRVLNNALLKQLYLCSLGYYPKAAGHYTSRKKGLPENFLFYCVDGNGWYKIDDKQYNVGPNEFFILPRNVAHAYGSSVDHPWSIYWIHFGGDLLAHFNELQTVQTHLKPFHIKNSNDIPIAFSKMYKTLELGYSIDNLMFANMCLLHFITLFIFNSKHYVISPTDKTNPVDRAILFMQEHINDNISLNELSLHFNYSPSRFSSLFKHKTGYAPIDYFIQMKMQKACQELDFSDRSIKEIALTMGFDDPYYFSRRFSKVIGMSPTKYRSVKKD